MSCRCPSEGIEPRIPISGRGFDRHTSTVAHSSRSLGRREGWEERRAVGGPAALAAGISAQAAAAKRSAIPASLLEMLGTVDLRLILPRCLSLLSVREDSDGGLVLCDISSLMSAAPSSSEVVELLARVPVFATLEREDLQRIAQLAVPRLFEPGQVVFRKGDASDTCYIVRSGHARAVREHPDGRTITLATFGPGDIFGELAMFEDERRSATVEAIEQTSAVAVLGPDMRRLMAIHPGISMRLAIALGRRLRESNERLARQSFQTVQSRVALVLGELVTRAIAEGSPQREVPVITTQADIAQLAGSSRESASRFLAVLERAGVISQGRGKLVVHDPSALEAYVY